MGFFLVDCGFERRVGVYGKIFVLGFFLVLFIINEYDFDYGDDKEG